jgi:long-chain acyl-CoA synthetase
MKLGSLVASLPAKKATIYTLERGKVSRHAMAALAGDAIEAAENLRRWGVNPGARVGIYAPNSYRWLVYDLALIELGAVSVPFTGDFAGKLDRALLDKYQMSLLLISTASPQAPAKEPHIAYIDAENENVAAIPRDPCENDAGLLTLSFSSGSAGGLKGLEISREGVETTGPPIFDAIGMENNDRLLLFMPMSNFQQRNMCYFAIWYDFDLIITDYVQLMAGITTLHPTILVAPPMYFQMIYTRFVNFPPFKKAAWTFLGNLLSFIPIPRLRRALAEILFGEFYRQFGGRMRLLITGMAPIKRDVATFFAKMQLPLCETYGLMETGSLTYRPANSKKFGSVGKPVPGVGLEFTEDGEIIVRREKSLTKRYFQSVEGENERTFIGPGRIATGDMGKLDQDGYLYLLGRKKELIVTSGGYKIHPELVENELAGCPDIAQAAVFLKPGGVTLAAVIVLNHPENQEARPRTRDFVKKMTTTQAAPIGDVIFAEAAFSVDNGMLRPNMKLDRRAIAAKHNLS